ncbi:MAG TPA: radical SAM protein [Clostridiaceae bacterium]|jgi:radical SAM protein with 4Fe4S-binding SPASM domain|nr:radical SAM protein [Clostridia bacterium]MBP8634299.1 radical SAM protein [Clostridia bacterium]HJJ17974.1 radical SAM protein [Clostridiaceae bacterium]
MEAEETEKQIKNIGWTLGNDCPCKCKHCYSMSVREKGKNLTKEIVDKVIKQVKKIGVETINLGGNEPIFTNGLKVQDSLLPYILKELTKRNIKVGITTSGISLIALKNVYPECLKLLNDVDISLDSPYEKEHNENRGGDVYKYAIEALEICKKNDIKSGIIMCAMNWNFTKDRIDALLELAKKYDSNIRFNLLKPIQPKHFQLIPSKEQVLENYKYLFKKCDTVELSEPTLSGLVDNNKIRGCACGIYSMRINSITPDGKIPVSPCVYMHDYRVGDLLTDDIFDIVNSEQFNSFKIRKENYEKIEGCKDCDKAEICRGGCFAMAYTYKKCETGKKDLYARDPFCFKEINFNDNIEYKKGEKQLVHENYLCTWIGKPKK